MNFYIEGYQGPNRIVSVAKNNEAIQKIISDGHWALDLSQNILIKDYETSLSLCITQKEERTSNLSNYDVVVIEENGVARPLYSAASNCNAIFITGKCNSNCIMCPNGEHLLRYSIVYPLDRLKEIVEHIPTDAKYLTVTGGEPFLLGYDFFELMECLNEHLPGTSILLLTNGRALANKSFFTGFSQQATRSWRVAIPLHAGTQELHDAISRCEGSFRQTMAGLKNLATTEAEIEIRVVVSKLNYRCLQHVAELIVSKVPRVTRVNLIGLEMLGNAAINAGEVWIDYRASFPFIKPSIRFLIENGIDVSLYNFPLCAVESAYWSLCARSISDYKVRYEDDCYQCSVQPICGGIFSSTAQFGRFEVKPIEEGLERC